MGFVFAIYGLTLLTMGLSIGVSALARPASEIRRFFHLGVFSFTYAIFVWTVMFGGPNGLTHETLILCAVSFVALLCFGWPSRWKIGGQVWPIAGLAALIWAVAALLIKNPVALETFTRDILGVPAALLAAYALSFNSEYRAGDRGLPVSAVGSAGFIVFAASEMFSTPGAFFPANLLNTSSFESLFGISIVVPRLAAALVIFACVIAQLVGLDFSARKKLEGKAELTNERLQLAIRNLKEAQELADLGSWEWQAQTDKITWSEHLYRIYGYDPDAFVPTLDTFSQLVHPKDREFVAAIITQSQETGVPFSLDHRIIRPDGIERTVHAEVKFVPGASGLRILGVVRDVTEIRRVEQELEATKRNLEDAQRLAQIGSWEFSVDRNEMICSQQLYQIYGVEPRSGPAGLEIFLERCHPDDLSFVNQTVARSLEAGESYTVDHRIIRPDGSVRTVQVQVQVESDHEGKAVRTLGVVRDITDQRAAREELISAMQAAQAANEAKSRFIANMSHELRTPLNAIIGFSEVMRSELHGPLGSEKYREYCTDILSSGQHLLSLINDILSVSRLEVGKTELNEAEIDLDRLVGDCRRLIAGRAMEAGVELSAELEGNLPHLMADPRLMTQVLLNLLSNSVKFTPRGGRVTIAARLMDDGGIELAVRDTGIGMAPTQIDRIGTPFLQFDDPLTRKFEGSGLGLSIVKRLVELHGGELEVKSAVGEGTAAMVRMPAERTIWRRGASSESAAFAKA